MDVIDTPELPPENNEPQSTPVPLLLRIEKFLSCLVATAKSFLVSGLSMYY